jgi:hypothetical protein
MAKLHTAVETKDIVDALLKQGLTQQTIAAATGASDRSVRNWLKHSGILGIYEERLRELQEVVQVLADVMTPKGVDQWLRAKHRLLGGERAADALAAGRAAAVLDAARAYAEGVYL